MQHFLSRDFIASKYLYMKSPSVALFPLSVKGRIAKTPLSVCICIQCVLHEINDVTWRGRGIVALWSNT